VAVRSVNDSEQTGASRGIGKAIGTALAEAGADVAVNGPAAQLLDGSDRRCGFVLAPTRGWRA
jgi:NAD(P)-dependent dehydrogenase (short-subunit alcohol dehydrogenase family)